MYCSNCGSEISDKAFFCPKCGVKVKEVVEVVPASNNSTGASASAATSSTSTNTTVVVEKRGDGDLVLPIVSLLAYIFLYPIGLILNIVGLVSGKNKGCFLSLFIVFFVIPLILGIIFILLILLGAAVE